MNKKHLATVDEDSQKRHRKHKHKSKHKKHAIAKIPVFSSGGGSSTVTVKTERDDVCEVDLDDDDDDDIDDDYDDFDQVKGTANQLDSDGELFVDALTDVPPPPPPPPTAPTLSTSRQPASSSSSGLKLKFKLGGQSFGETSVAIVNDQEDEDNRSIDVVVDDDAPTVTVTVASDMSDEDAWLDALESGKLDEYDEMRRMKDPSLMTARQKALLESKSQLRQSATHVQPDYHVLPPPVNKDKEMTEEMIEKRELKAKKRRQQAQEKREKDKIQTIDRLLKKQESKPKGSKAARTHKRGVLEVPKFTYLCNKDSRTISVPANYSFGMQPTSQPRQLPRVRLCGAPNCTNPKRYACSRSGVPLCSLDCYKIVSASL